jgi:hypothetical protein
MSNQQVSAIAPVCYHRRMRAVPLVLAFALASAGASAADDPLARARLFYNQRQFVAAVSAAEQARRVPSRADSADLIAARAYLERYRESTAPDDLENARDRLRRLDPQRLAPGERAEFMVGLGEALYFDNTFGAAADVFQSVLARDEGLTPDGRERALDWWATAVDREARPRAEPDREVLYQRVRDRMEAELAVRPGSAAAGYWLAAAARAQGDLQAAWNASQAGWVRASLASDRGEALRADLDRLVLRAIIPERSRAAGQSAENLRLEWEKFKERWKKE